LGEAEPGALAEGLGGEELIYRPTQGFRSIPVPVSATLISTSASPTMLRTSVAIVDHPPSRHGVARVDRQVENRHLNLDRIAEHRYKTGI
jgi:hypothetical protein